MRRGFPFFALSAVKGLQHAEVALPGGERIAILAPYAEYIEGESRIEIDFNERLKPYILGMEGGKDSGKKHTDRRIKPTLVIMKAPGAVPMAPAFGWD
jgi:hypothetical protein